MQDNPHCLYCFNSKHHRTKLHNKPGNISLELTCDLHFKSTMEYSITLCISFNNEQLELGDCIPEKKEEKKKFIMKTLMFATEDQYNGNN